MKQKIVLLGVMCLLLLYAGSHKQESDPTVIEYRDTDGSNANSVMLCTEELEGDSEVHSEAQPVENVNSTGADDQELENQQISKEQLDLQIEVWLNRLSIEEKVAQLFVILPEVFSASNCVTYVDEKMLQSIQEIPVGGFVFLEQNLLSGEQVKGLLGELQRIETERIGLPAFLCVDEEGGTVTRISGRENFDVPYVGSMSNIGATQDIKNAYEAGNIIGQYLSELGFNIDFAPVADVWNNPANQVVQYRSFGTDAQLAADMCIAFSEGLRKWNVYATWKHFPGHGATEADTHQGYAYTDKTLEELQLCDLIPFQQGINDGTDFIMTGHISLPNITGNHTPASLSEVIINQILREQMGYDGIVITDAMNMGAIVQNYNSADAAIQAILAGADMILMPADFYSAYQGVLQAVNCQKITIERLDESIKKILKVKLRILSITG